MIGQRSYYWNNYITKYVYLSICSNRARIKAFFCYSEKVKILFTGGGTGGHFYPIIAVAEAVHDVVRQEHLLDPSLYYAAPKPYDREMLQANDVTFVGTAAGKMRRYFSLLNFFDWFKTGWGIFRSVLRIFFLYPDVVFGKGGYASFPTLLAARLFGIPVVIHESDTVPGKVNAWAGKFARKIAVSFPETAALFPADKTIVTGQPIRKAALHPSAEGAREFLKLEPSVPIIFVIGGSQGSVALNEAMLGALPQLLPNYQVVHQCGEANIEDVAGRARIIVGNTPYKDRYKPFGYLNDVAMRMSAGAASLVVSRAGSGLFEIAAWGLPSILVPLPDSAEDHQVKNAFAYARTGACAVIEQNNLTPGLLTAEITRILANPQIAAAMSAAAKKYSRADAAETIARLLLDIAVSHEA